MSSSSEDDCYSNCAQKLQALQTKWKPDVINSEAIEINEDNEKNCNDTVDASCSTTSDVSSAILSKTKKKKLKHRIRAKKMCSNADDSTTSYEGEKLSTQRATRSMARRSNKNDADNFRVNVSIVENTPFAKNNPAIPNRRANASSSRSRRRNASTRNQSNQRQSYINIGCSSEEETDQPLFAKADDANTDKSISNSSTDNQVVRVKVIWKSCETYYFDLRKYEKLSKIYDHFSQLAEVPSNRLLFSLQDKILSSNDTLETIGFKSYHSIDGGIVSTDVNNLTTHSDQHLLNKDAVVLKFQCGKLKNPLEISLTKNSKMSIGMIKFSEEIEVPLSKLRFEFDGDILRGDQSLKSLELEGGECIDVYIEA